MKQNGPKYSAIYSSMRMDILSGKYPSGSFLPPESELMRLYDASRTTIRRAISMLAENHFVKVQQGRGTEVLPIETFLRPDGFSKYRNATEVHGRFLMGGERNLTVQSAAIDMIPAGPDAAEAFHLSTGTSVYRLQRIQYVNDEPFAYMLDYLHPRYVPDLGQFSNKITNLHKFLNEQYHIRLGEAEETVSASLAGFLEAQLLHMEMNEPIFLLKRVSYFNEFPIKYSVTTIKASIFQFVIHIHDEDSASHLNEE